MIETSIIPPSHDISVDRLRNTMREMNPVATCTHEKIKFYVNPVLKTCSHVFLRIDSVKPPLCQPYIGTHKVLKRTEKNFTIELNGRTSTVPIDRVKPAYLIPTCEEKTPILQAEKTVSPETFQSDNHQSANPTEPNEVCGSILVILVGRRHSSQAKHVRKSDVSQLQPKYPGIDPCDN
ncbi:hypothetical protein AVEN_24319-1 [Araneus ventricosus]|uniref:Uncharacterized protein n=1 Tax=Araneus ventricosus TaxID=182803 RepID=A0A4Y2X7X1_ARAVE|nr:hypothetical protein AVEN_24319-1 [Araneus ventricosus]